MSWKKKIIITATVFLLSYILLSIPFNSIPQVRGAGNKPFAWNQDQMWKALESRFREVRSAGCPSYGHEIRKDVLEGYRHLVLLAQRPLDPTDPLFDAVEANLFGLGTLVAACTAELDAYTKLENSLRDAVKLQSRAWDVTDRKVRDRLYRLLYGGRAALEEIILQAGGRPEAVALLGRKEPSATPSYTHSGVELHSGDILVSRGGAPTSALIARGNDYPGNFSHIAFLYVDEVTKKPSIIEAHIERGVVISTVEEYLKDKKLRVMALRVRSDHPLLLKDPMLPHRAAKMAYDDARRAHIPYDFEMNYREPSKRFCSEVASHAYSSYGITLWNIITTMSSPGVVNWLGDLGVRYFETQAPADLEYDPQLVVVAEWRDTGVLWDDHVDNAIIDAMIEGAERGAGLTYNRYLLAPARLVKAYSALLNLFGGVGPIPEGMSSEVALKSQDLDKLHKKMKASVLTAAASFEEKNGYRPPYWELVKMARDAYNADRKL